MKRSAAARYPVWSARHHHSTVSARPAAPTSNTKVGAVGFILIPNLTSYAITLQLAGGVWILQTPPAVILALFVRRLDAWAIGAGWLAGMVTGTWWLVVGGSRSSLATYPIGGARGTKLYIGLVAFLVNIVVVGVGSAVMAYVRRAAEEDREAAAA